MGERNFKDLAAPFAGLNLSGVTPANFGRHLAVRLSELTGIDIEVGFSAPVSGGTNPADTLFAINSATKDEFIGRRQDLESRAYDFFYAKAPDVDELNLLHPETIILSEKKITEDMRVFLQVYTRAIIAQYVYKQRSVIRRSIINVKIESQDLNSFFYKILRPEFMYSLGIEAASVFVINARSQLLHLRGTTGLKADIPISEVFFDKAKHRKKIAKVWTVHKDQKPLFEFDTEGLSEGKSAERLQSAPYGRAYWPIQLQFARAPHSAREGPESCYGTVRVVNRVDQNDKPIKGPLRWLDLAAIEFACESFYNIVDAYNDAELASFKKDESFHGAMGVVDAAAKGIDKSRRMILDYRDSTILDPQRFKLVPFDERRHFDPESARFLLNTAYACVKDLGFQIERANNAFVGDPSAATARLITDVLKPGVDLIQDMCIAHSANHGHKVTNVLSFLNTAETLPPAVRGEKGALLSVFCNIFENSVKYSKRGHPVKIEIGVEVKEHDVDIRIKDSGIGIEQQEESHIFVQGYRSDRALAHASRGSGLGLSWCQSVLNFYGGKITAERWSAGIIVTVRLKKAGGSDGINLDRQRFKLPAS